MIRCRPHGICSWNFTLEGDGHQAMLHFNWLGEQGTIAADGQQFVVEKDGVFSGQWSLVHTGVEIASAQKSSAFTRTFEIQTQGETLVLAAESPLGRSFQIEHLGAIVATVAPDHPFTRRASIELLTHQLDFAVVSFSFWLVVLTWRRAAQSNS